MSCLQVVRKETGKGQSEKHFEQGKAEHPVLSA